MRKMGNVRRPRLSALAIAVQAALGLPAAWALPQGATVIHGQVGIAQPVPGQMQVTAGDGAIINWQRFSIGPGELARFIQPSAQSAVLNRVVGASAKPSPRSPEETLSCTRCMTVSLRGHAAELAPRLAS